MFVAYLIPPAEDHHLLVEDGLGFVAKGATREEAMEALRKQWVGVWDCEPDEGQRQWDEMVEGNSNHALHITEV